MTKVYFSQKLFATETLLLLGNFFVPRAGCFSESVADVTNRHNKED